MPKISVVIPTFNEEESIAPLFKKITRALKGKDYEVIFIDDGSTDKTFSILMGLQKKNRDIRIIKLRKNFGQTAALDAGFKNSKGEVVVAIDADLQNDPNDIPRLLEKLNEGYDVVSGWRYDRKDPFTKNIISSIANLLRRTITGEKIHDSGCSLKAYKRKCVVNLSLYGEMHRFIPAILLWKGFKVTEIKVNHNPRKYGKTKYNIIRVFKGFLDLLVVAFWQKYSARPIHLFGSVGLVTSALGFIIGVYLAALKLFYGYAIADRPLLLLAILMILLGIQFIIFGLLADILIKIYYSKDQHYSIEKIIE